MLTRFTIGSRLSLFRTKPLPAQINETFFEHSLFTRYLLKKTWRATNKEVIRRHQARSCILKSFWLWFLRSYVLTYDTICHGQILSAFQIEYRIKIRKLWRMMDIICSRLALSVHVNQSSSSCEVM